MKIKLMFFRKNIFYYWFWISTFSGLFPGNSFALGISGKEPPGPVVHTGRDGKLVYSLDSLGNRVPDFSYCGYKASEEPIPMAPVKVVVPLSEGDATVRIQKAIDYVTSLPADVNGIKGAVLLQKGTYHLTGRLMIKDSGVVIRGSGMGTGGTVLIAEGKSRETLIRIAGGDSLIRAGEYPVSEDYVPVNASRVAVDHAASFHAGETIFIRRPSTQEWIDRLKMNSFGGETGWLGWKPGERDIVWDRTVKAIHGDTLILDAPLTTALDKKYGGGFVSSYASPERISGIGIENLALVSVYDKSNPKDEEHCWEAITFENVRDAWVRQVAFTHFAGSAVAVYESASRITVEDCKSFQPVSEIGGLRRYTFYTQGQQTLFQNLYAEFGYHDFGTGFCAAGPNAFVQCFSHLPYSFSGAIDSWASGVLFDIVNVDGQALSIKNRGQDDYGAGWTAANSMFWQCSAARIDCFAPPTSENWAFGAWSEFAGDGYWYEANSHINPRSLYYAQLKDRLGKDAVYLDPVMYIKTDATSSPTIKEAAELISNSVKPAMTLAEWIDQAPSRNPIDISAKNAPSVDQLKFAITKKQNPVAPPMALKNGWLVRGDKVLTGKRQDVPWWHGDLRPRSLAQATPAITRYVPGRHGTGYTDNLDDVVSWMKKNNYIGIEQHYALWYERRRDDHERIRRMDGEVWAPFYELPFERTGIDLAWDGLSKYDLTKYNTWYWSRLKQFANLADQKGVVLIHQDYFQHNILEAGAHWVDCPWRPVNNINGTGFPEPPPFAGDKRIFLAEQFYDETNPVRRELHKAYIRQCLNNFDGNSGVIQLIGAEFTGPLHFVKFWVDEIKEWEQETGKKAFIGLSTTKDVQDSILADPKRSSVIDLIDIRYWSSKADGSLYAPEGGKNLAPRQFARIMKTGKRSFDQVYQDVLAYKTKFPDKAVIYSENMSDNFAWAIFMAGGSLANIPKIKVAGFLDNASSMHPVQEQQNGYLELKNEKGECILYPKDKGELSVLLPSGHFRLSRISTLDGQAVGKTERLKGGGMIRIANSDGNDEVLWISKM